MIKIEIEGERDRRNKNQLGVERGRRGRREIDIV